MITARPYPTGASRALIPGVAPKRPLSSWRGNRSFRLVEVIYQAEGFTVERRTFKMVLTRSWGLTMTCFMFLVLERHRVVAPTSARPLAAPVPAL